MGKQTIVLTESPLLDSLGANVLSHLNPNPKS